jgi:hypothetical protein
MLRYLAILAVVVGLEAGAGQAQSGTFVFSDGTFNDSDWFIPQEELPAAIRFVGQVATGGNPGSYRATRISVGQDVPGVANLNRNFVYTPSVQGAITGITINWDLETTNAEGATYIPLIEQNGTLYLDGVASISASANSWSNSTRILTLADFSGLNNSSLTPDFSSSGSPITFGYQVFAGGSGFFESDTGIDNDPITLTTAALSKSSVPEPSTLLFGCVAAALAAFRCFCRRRTCLLV